MPSPRGEGIPRRVGLQAARASVFVAARFAPPPLHRRGPVHVQRGTRWKRGVVKHARRSAMKPASQVLRKRRSGAVVPRAATPQRGRCGSPASCRQTRAACADARSKRSCLLSALHLRQPRVQRDARAGFDRDASRAGRTPYARRGGWRLGGPRCPLNAGTVWSRRGCGSWQLPLRPHRNDGTRRAFGRRGGGAGST